MKRMYFLCVMFFGVQASDQADLIGQKVPDEIAEAIVEADFDKNPVKSGDLIAIKQMQGGYRYGEFQTRFDDKTAAVKTNLRSGTILELSLLRHLPKDK